MRIAVLRARRLERVLGHTKLLRLNEAQQVMQTFARSLGVKVVHVDAGEQFLGKLRGVTDPEQKLAVLEDAEALREFFLASMEAQKEIAPQIRVRIDDIALVGADRAEVTYTLLLDGAAVLDHLPGEAVKVGDQWLVTRRSFCDVSTQGATEIPPPCL